MPYDFDSVVDRTGTGSLKWERYAQRDILPMWVADMDFRSPPEVQAALLARAQHGVYGYTLPPESVTEAVLDYLQRTHQIAAKKEWLVWLPGLVPALNVLCRACGEVGDAVMTVTPVYPPFITAPKYARRELISVPLVFENDRWTFDFGAMERAVTPRTRAFLLCSPHNPVGRVWSRRELQELAAFCLRHNLILCSDEIHADLVLHEQLRHQATMTLGEEIAARTISLFAPSKTYNLAGLACAFAVIPDERLRGAFQLAARGLITEINAFGYAGCEAAYRHGEPWRLALLDYLRGNRDCLYSWSQEALPGVRLHPVDATYLAWLDVSGLGLEDATAFFEQHGVGLSDGRQFGDHRFVRLNFGCPRRLLVQGLERLNQALVSLRA